MPVDVRDELRDAGILPHTFPYEDALKMGFVSANACRLSSEIALDALDNLDGSLSKLKLSPTDLIANEKAELDRVKEALARHGKNVPLWFSVGFSCFAATWTFVTAANERIFVSGGPCGDEAVGDMLSHNRDVRRACSNFIGSLQDIGWSPDKIERFVHDKLYPFLWDPGHQKWVFSLDMGIMQDLAFKARKKDKVLRDFEQSRLVGVISALIQGIPVVGKAIATAIFGPTR